MVSEVFGDGSAQDSVGRGLSISVVLGDERLPVTA